MDILRTIDSPADLKALPDEQLPLLAQQIREFLIHSLSRTGGHLGPNLGVVELTIALHRVFNSPKDPILFDTGHQAYVHKLLTGRRELFTGLRTQGGLSGYPSRAESEHDWIENSHASVALSHADGLARGFLATGQQDRRVIAVVGDGALTGGMAWEALNSICADQSPVTIVLNDNGRSYAPTVGKPIALLEAAGLPVIGPVVGHDVNVLQEALNTSKAHPDAPVAIHIRTEKSHGYSPAKDSSNDELLHSVSAFNPATGPVDTSVAETWTGVLSGELLEHFTQRKDLVAVTAAMSGPTGLTPIARRFPERVRDVGIAEQHAVTSAAGMASAGLHPVVAVYSTFFHRAFDQMLLDVALHRLPVTFILDRAGVTGSDGPSHNGAWDLVLCASVPGVRVAAPRDGLRLRRQLAEALAHQDGPTVVRFPKGALPAEIPAVRQADGVDVLREEPKVSAEGSGVLIVSVGACAQLCLDAAELLEAGDLGIAADVIDPGWAVPTPNALIDVIRQGRYRLIAVVEDGVVRGGIGSLIAEELSAEGIDIPVRRFGLPTEFLQHGSREQVLAHAGMTAEAIARRIGAVVESSKCRPDR